MTCPRDIIKTIVPFLKRKEYLAIIGPRQSGKTTFLGILRTYLNREMKIKPNRIAIITFEDRRLLAQFDSDPIAFIRSYMPKEGMQNFYLMIDEFQYAVDGGQKLKLIYDTIKGLKIIVTGSSSLDIKAQVGRYMVGRMLTFHLYPFNFGETLHMTNKRMEEIYRKNNPKVLDWLLKRKPFMFKKGTDVFHEEMNKYYEDFCMWGGFPAVVATGNRNVRKKILADIYDSYIMKDVKTLLALVTEKNLYLLSQYLATQTGNIVLYQNLSQVAGLDFRNLKKHLNILRETFICQELRPFFRNREKELTKNPKIYFLDLGFRNNLIEDFNSLEKRPDRGAIIENAVFIKLHGIFHGIEKVNFWRTKSGAEVDFVLRIKDSILPIEVKYSDFVSEKVSRSFASFVDCFKPATGLVLTKNYWGTIKKNKTQILFIPVYYL